MIFVMLGVDRRMMLWFVFVVDIWWIGLMDDAGGVLLGYAMFGCWNFELGRGNGSERGRHTTHISET